MLLEAMHVDSRNRNVEKILFLTKKVHAPEGIIFLLCILLFRFIQLISFEKKKDKYTEQVSEKYNAFFVAC